MDHKIPVICDRCRAEGLAGWDGFSGISDILDFEPVPRRPRADGWTGELQRAFIAALAVTGTAARAARAIGKHAFGAEQLRKARGGRAFAAAWDAALDLYRERELHHLHDNLAELSAKQQALMAADPLSAGGDPEARQLARNVIASMEMLGAQYYRVCVAEREKRREGNEEEADFYLRQLTGIEFYMGCGERLAGKVMDEAQRAIYGLSDWPPKAEPKPSPPTIDYLNRLRETAWKRVDGEEAWPYGEELSPYDEDGELRVPDNPNPLA